MREKGIHNMIKKSLNKLLYVGACLIFVTATVMPQPAYSSGIPFYEINETGEKQVKLGQEEYDIDNHKLVVFNSNATMGEQQLFRESFFHSDYHGDVPNPPPEN